MKNLEIKIFLKKDLFVNIILIIVKIMFAKNKNFANPTA